MSGSDGPRPGRIDWPQLRALLTLTLGQGYRRGISPLTGAIHDPLRQIVLSFGFLGLVACVNLYRVHDAATFYSLVFAASFTLVLTGISPDVADARHRNADVLGSRPISGATAHALRFVTFVFMGMLLSVPLALPGLVAAWLYFHLPIHVALLQFAMLLVQAAVTGLLWMQFFAVAVRWISIESLRRASQLMTVGMLLAISFGSMALVSGVLDGANVLGVPAHAAGRAILQAMPSTSFAMFAIAGDNRMAVAHRLGVLALVGLTLVLPWIGNLERRNARLADAIQSSLERMSSRAVRVHASLRVRFLRAVSWLLAPQSAAVAETVLVHGERDEFTRVRSLAQSAMAVVFFLILIAAHRPRMALLPLTYVSFAALMEALDGARRSPQWAAGWIFFASPIRPRHVVTGLQVAIVLRSLLLPVALTVGLLLWQAWLPGAVIAALAYLLALRLSAAACMAMRPGLPLATGERAFAELAGLGIAAALGIGTTAILLGILVMAERLRGPGIVLGLGALLILVQATIATERIAASRLGSLEHAA